MLDEFDDPMRPAPVLAPRDAAPDATPRHRFAAARLVSRVYRTANEALRADMLACLLRPLGTLSLVAVASGAFARMLQSSGTAPDRVRVDEAAQYSSDQILELAVFVQEASPDAMQQVAALLAQHPMSATALSASALLVLYRKLRAVPADPPTPRA
jgi:hypothetical protein